MIGWLRTLAVAYLNRRDTGLTSPMSSTPTPARHSSYAAYGARVVFRDGCGGPYDQAKAIKAARAARQRSETGRRYAVRPAKAKRLTVVAMPRRRA